jgi:hypothetical protein
MLAPMQQNPSRAWTRLRRHPERGAYDAASIHAILDAARWCHIGQLRQDRVVVLPSFHWRQGERVYWHAAAANPLAQAAAEAPVVCLTASLLDGWVLARTPFAHSANFRSVVCFGQAVAVTDEEEKRLALKAFFDKLYPGRWELCRPPTPRELRATAVLWLPLDQASAKIRRGGPHDLAEDGDWPVWAGVLPVALAAGAPIAEPGLQPGLQPPPCPL